MRVFGRNEDTGEVLFLGRWYAPGSEELARDVEAWCDGLAQEEERRAEERREEEVSGKEIWKA